jgi:hypothetical protein
MRRERFESLALAILLSIGAGVVWGMLSGWGMAILNDVLAPRGVYQHLIFLADGTPLIRSYDTRNYQEATFCALDGKPLKLSREASERTINGEYLTGPGYQRSPFHGLSWQDRVILVDNDSYDAEVWYFVHDGKLDGHGYLVGYGTKTKAKIGYIGRGGFRPDEPPPDEQFPVSGRKMSRYGGPSMIGQYYQGGYYNGYGGGPRNAKCLLADDGLMTIDLNKRSVKYLRKGTDLISGLRSLLPGPSAKTASPDEKGMPVILLRTPGQIVVLAADGKEIKTYRLPAELRDADLQWIALPGGKTLVGESYLGRERRRHELFWFDAGGKVVEHKQFELQFPRDSEFMQVAAPSVIVPSPASIAGVMLCYPWGMAEVRESLPYSAALGKALAKIWPILLVTGIVSVVLAVLCYRRQRRYGLPWTWVWTIFVLLFGLPAYFGYVAHRVWPARLPCPHCGQLVPRDRPACCACGRDFPAPAAKGIEVFA